MQKLRVHVQRSAKPETFFHVSEQNFGEALARHRSIEGAIAVTFGSTEADFLRDVATAEVLLTDKVGTTNLSVIAPDLRWIQAIQTGVERLLPLIPTGVTLTNAAGVDAQKAAEFVIGALILLNGAFPRFLAQQRCATWRPIFTSPLAEKTVLIVGTGTLGRAVAREARHFGMKVIGISRTGRVREGFDACEPVTNLARQLPCAAFLVLALPSTAATRGLIGRHELDELPRTAGVVNIGRADVMDYPALAAKLAAGELAGAVLDVFATEPLPPDSPLWRVPNLFVTPHCAIDDPAGYVPSVLDLFFDNVRRYLAKRPLRNVVDVALGY